MHIRVLAISTSDMTATTPAGALGQAFLDAGHTLFVAAPTVAGESPAQARARLGVSGFLRLRPGEGALALLLNSWSVSRWARRLGVQLILADSPAAGVVSYQARSAQGEQTLAVLLLDRVPPMAGFLSRLLAARCVQQCDRLIIARPELREPLIALGARRADTLFFASEREAATFCLTAVRGELPGQPEIALPRAAGDAAGADSA